MIDDWRADKYRWINQGVTQLPRKNPSLRKHYFAADTPQGVSKDFQRHAYQLLGDKTITLIHYVGDEKVAVDFCHRSTKKHSNQAFIRTQPSSLRKYEELCKSDKANVVYKRAVASMGCNPEHVAVQTPRNMKQLRNLRFKHLHQTRISTRHASLETASTTSTRWRTILPASFGRSPPFLTLSASVVCR